MEHRERFKFEDIEHILMNFKRWLKKAGKSLAKCVGRIKFIEWIRQYYYPFCAIIISIAVSFAIVYYGLKGNIRHHQKELERVNHIDSIVDSTLEQQHRIEELLDTISREIPQSKLLEDSQCDTIPKY